MNAPGPADLWRIDMNQRTDTPRQMCCVPDCTEHPSWLRPVAERPVYAAASRVAS